MAESPMTWIFSGVGIAIISFIVYLYKKYVRHLKFEPSIFINGYNSNQIDLSRYVSTDIQARVEALVAQEDNRLPSYQVQNLNPYNNPLLALESVSAKVKNQQHYMSQKAQYLRSYREYQMNMILQNDSDAAMVPIPLMLRNSGGNEGTNIEIELTLKGMFYCETSKVERQSSKVKVPIDNGNNSAAIMLTPIENEDYTYHTWTLKSPLASPIVLEKDQINPRSTTKEPLLVLYVNTAMANEDNIHYKIYASTLTDPIEGDIVINVN